MFPGIGDSLDPISSIKHYFSTQRYLRWSNGLVLDAPESSKDHQHKTIAGLYLIASGLLPSGIHHLT